MRECRWILISERQVDVEVEREKSDTERDSWQAGNERTKISRR